MRHSWFADFCRFSLALLGLVKLCFTYSSGCYNYQELFLFHLIHHLSVLGCPSLLLLQFSGFSHTVVLVLLLSYFAFDLFFLIIHFELLSIFRVSHTHFLISLRSDGVGPYPGGVHFMIVFPSFSSLCCLISPVFIEYLEGEVGLGHEGAERGELGCFNVLCGTKTV